MSDMIEVLFKVNRKGYCLNSLELALKIGDCVVVEGERGMEVGMVCGKGVIAQLRQEKWKASVGKVLRLANEDDMNKYKARTAREDEALCICQEKVKAHSLDMELIDVEFFDKDNKVCFYFIADDRVDFRQLVKDLAAIFKMRIELKQIGVRDRARLCGGYGRCGRKLCCATFLKEFEPVTLKAAKDQDLSLNPANISGCCGRLMCCLIYERDFYVECRATFPPLGGELKTRKGTERVKKVDFFKGSIELVKENGDSREVSLRDLRMEVNEME
jgi:cell fate regulator YaaT (PSP1 superfamily)